MKIVSITSFSKYIVRSVCNKQTFKHGFSEMYVFQFVCLRKLGTENDPLSEFSPSIRTRECTRGQVSVLSDLYNIKLLWYSFLFSRAQLSQPVCTILLSYIISRGDFFLKIQHFPATKFLDAGKYSILNFCVTAVLRFRPKKARLFHVQILVLSLLPMLFGRYLLLHHL